MKENHVSAVEFPGQTRIHIGLAAGDLDRSRAFYRTLLGVEPSKERPGYVKFEPADPSVNLTLNQSNGSKATSNLPTHYGIQVKSTQAVEEASQRLRQAGIEVKVEEQTACCYAVQDKVWANDPDGNEWEVFVVTQADAPERRQADSDCCSEAETECCSEEDRQRIAAAGAGQARTECCSR
ncbi:MAG TPA: ArsI/CadI family heavy metal resistance metalloenzyme [Acidobacteriota bacterium]|nr:ArsI/CadI family heavy metal resistance metalloenzyme [Acidobacteriota bacterium]